MPFQFSSLFFHVCETVHCVLGVTLLELTWMGFCFSFLFFFFKLLFTYFKGGREKERERSIIVVASHLAPHWGPGPQHSHVPRLGMELVTLWFAASTQIHWATPARAFFKKIIYLFIFKEGKGGRREGNINMWMPPEPPYCRPGPHPRHVPWLEIELVTLWFEGYHSSHWALPVRAGFCFLYRKSIAQSTQCNLSDVHCVWTTRHFLNVACTLLPGCLVCILFLWQFPPYLYWAHLYHPSRSRCQMSFLLQSFPWFLWANVISVLSESQQYFVPFWSHSHPFIKLIFVHLTLCHKTVSFWESPSTEGIN